MKLLIDDADVDAIQKACELYPIDGVTTNPSILAKYKRDPYDILKEIRAIIGKEADLHVQAVSRDAAGMVQEAHSIVKELGEATFVKIPCVPEGFKAIRTLAKEGIRTTGTVVYTPLQAYLAGKSGAAYAAPYVNRIDNMGYDGIRVVKEIQEIFSVNRMETGVLAASFKNSQQVLALCRCGVTAATVAPEVIESFVKNAAVTAAVDDFAKDFRELAGEGRTMYNG